jgi:hypothetical protein
MYLTAPELAALTGYRDNQFALMARWLRANGWPFEVARGGCPRVLRAYHDQRLSGQLPPAPAAARPDAATEPNFEALRALRRDRKTPIPA